MRQCPGRDTHVPQAGAGARKGESARRDAPAGHEASPQPVEQSRVRRLPDLRLPGSLAGMGS